MVFLKNHRDIFILICIKTTSRQKKHLTGSPNNRQFIKPTRIDDHITLNSTNSPHKSESRPLNKETVPLTTENRNFYGMGNSSKDLNSATNSLHGNVNPAFENTTPTKKNTVFKPVYAHTEEERNAMLERKRVDDKSVISDPNDFFMNSHRYRRDSQKYFWNPSMRSSGENEGHSLSSLSHLPSSLLSRGTSVRSVCKNGEFKTMYVFHNYIIKAENKITIYTSLN